MTKITKQNVSAPPSYIGDVKIELTRWRFSSKIQLDEWKIIREVYNDNERAEVASSAIINARIDKFNARGKGA